MGGHALKHTPTHRLTADAYHALTDRVLRTLRTVEGARVEVIRSYAAKPDFGDMDVLVDRTSVPADLAGMVTTLFAPNELVRNGPVISFDVEAFQVDLICVPSTEFATSRDYFAYNDLGNLMGRTAHRMGFTYGHNGLRYKLREGNFLVADLQVTADMASAFAFMGYDHARFEKGFQRREDLFVFAASSPYFTPSAYALEARGHRNRVRDRKRENYQRFLAWLDAEQVPTGAVAHMANEEHLSRAEHLFPAFAQALQATREDLLKARHRKTIFNGERVATLTGLEGKALGLLLRRLRDDYPGGPVAFNAYLDALDPDQTGTLEHYIHEVADRLSPNTPCTPPSYC